VLTLQQRIWRFESTLSLSVKPAPSQFDRISPAILPEPYNFLKEDVSFEQSWVGYGQAALRCQLDQLTGPIGKFELFYLSDSTGAIGCA
jgi:hypothetical protein